MSNKNKLTYKQNKFAELVVELGNQNEAYRQAYDVKTTNLNSISVKSCRLAQEPKIKLRIEELKSNLAKKNNLTKQKIIDYHMKMVNAWEELWELGKKQNKTKDEKQRFYLLKEMVKGSDYRGSLDSLSKMLGLNEPEKHIHEIQRIEIIERGSNTNLLEE